MVDRQDIFDINDAVHRENHGLVGFVMVDVGPGLVIQELHGDRGCRRQAGSGRIDTKVVTSNHRSVCPYTINQYSD